MASSSPVGRPPGGDRPAGCTPSRTPAGPTWTSGRGRSSSTSRPWTPSSGSTRGGRCRTSRKRRS
ncbi:MAG: Transcriptional regulator, PadR family, partial [uncultured Rubrobacteraceae bacterium]